MNKLKLKERVAIELSLDEWLCVYSHISLALRHPRNVGRASEVGKTVLKAMEDMFLKEGLMDSTDIAVLYNIKDQADINQKALNIFKVIQEG